MYLISKLMALNSMMEEIQQDLSPVPLEEWRKKLGIKRAKLMRPVMRLKAGKARKTQNTKKMHVPIRKGAAYNRHRRS